MKAMRYHAYGAADVLRCEDAPPPALLDSDLLIKVHAAGVNPADAQFRRGDYREIAPLPLPFIPGWDVAGTVVAVGSGERRFRCRQRERCGRGFSTSGQARERADASQPEPAR